MTPLTKDMVSAPQMWRMSMLIAPTGVDIALMSMVEDNSLIYRHIPIDPLSASVVGAVEDIVYDNPLLLADFGKTDILLATRRMMPIPSELTPELTEQSMRLFWPDLDAYQIFTDHPLPAPADADALAYAAERPLASFLQRTFPAARIWHALSPLARYLSGNSRLGNSGKLYACLRPGQMDLLAFTPAGLMMCNTLDFNTPDDAVYFLLAAMRQCGFPPESAELLLCGDKDLREQLTPVLRRFVGYVMPVIFPSAMFRAGRDAMLVPFNLIVLPLCE